jgi:hypothetical protein
MIATLVLSTCLVIVATNKPASVADPNPRTVQLQCGVNPGEEVSRAEAACIAYRIGLGHDRWWVRRSDDSDPWVWFVTPLLDADKVSDRDRRIVWIDPVGGRIRGLFPSTWDSSIPPAAIVELTLEPGPKIQEQCGVDPFAWVTDDDALCLASGLGMPGERSAWSIFRHGDTAIVNTTLSRAKQPECMEHQYRVILGIGGNVQEVLSIGFTISDGCEEPPQSDAHFLIPWDGCHECFEAKWRLLN